MIVWLKNKFMNVSVGLMLLFFSMTAFYYFNKKRDLKNRRRKEKLDEMRQELIDTLRRKKLG